MKPSICFVALNAYNVLSRRADIRHIGGAEVQQSLIARELAKRGYRVSFVTLDHGQRDAEVIDGITLYKAYRPAAGIPKLRFVHPRLTGLWAAMARADTDTYYQRGAESETGLVANWCRRNRRKFVFALAGQHMIVSGGTVQTTSRERLLFRYGMSRADLVLVQSAEQQVLLHHDWGLASHIVLNGCVLPEAGASPEDNAAQKRVGVLWVGRFNEVKRLDWCLNLAEALPHVSFDVVGSGAAGSARTRRYEARAATLPNVTMHGYLDRTRLAHMYGAARVLLCTSRSEGFPNVFLEAWSHATPVVSTVDPDGCIRAHQLGWVVRTPEALVDIVARLDRAELDWPDRSRNAHTYVRRERDIAVVTGRLEGLLRSL